MEKRRQDTAEFKREAVRLSVTSGKPIAQVARELGISRWACGQRSAYAAGAPVVGIRPAVPF